mmetsp:Transcript_22437/g.63685  ORF Transcript_22437/g.63685 Transcript_22437/m.63685 type:complete len:493 (+) Transcript_22437:617-2095(+)
MYRRPLSMLKEVRFTGAVKYLSYTAQGRRGHHGQVTLDRLLAARLVRDRVLAAAVLVGRLGTHCLGTRCRPSGLRGGLGVRHRRRGQLLREGDLVGPRAAAAKHNLGQGAGGGGAARGGRAGDVALGDAPRPVLVQHRDLRLEPREPLAADGVGKAEKREEGEHDGAKDQEGELDGGHRGGGLLGGALLRVEARPAVGGEDQRDDDLGEVLADAVTGVEHPLPPQPAPLDAVFVDRPPHQHVRDDVVRALRHAEHGARGGGGGGELAHLRAALRVALCFQQEEEEDHQPRLDRAQDGVDGRRVRALEEPQIEGQREDARRDDGQHHGAHQKADLRHVDADDVDEVERDVGEEVRHVALREEHDGGVDAERVQAEGCPERGAERERRLPARLLERDWRAARRRDGEEGARPHERDEAGDEAEAPKLGADPARLARFRVEAARVGAQLQRLAEQAVRRRVGGGGALGDVVGCKGVGGEHPRGGGPRGGGRTLGR